MRPQGGIQVLSLPLDDEANRRGTKYIEPCLRDACNMSSFRLRYSSISSTEGTGEGEGDAMSSANRDESRNFLAATVPPPRVGLRLGLGDGIGATFDESSSL